MQSSMKHCKMMLIYLLPTIENSLTVHKMKANNKNKTKQGQQQQRTLIVASFAKTKPSSAIHAVHNLSFYMRIHLRLLLFLIIF